MALMPHVAVFWDYENCRPPSNASGYSVIDGILKAVQDLGSIILFKAYVELTLDAANSKTMLLHSELQSSGVSLTHCPHNGKKDVADKMMIADMLAFAIDNPAPATIVLITGDRDFAYAASLLRLRGYVVIVIVPPPAHISLKMQASKVLDWQKEVLGCVELQREKTSVSECPEAFPASPLSDLNSEGNGPIPNTVVGVKSIATGTFFHSLSPIFEPTAYPQPTPEIIQNYSVPSGSDSHTRSTTDNAKRLDKAIQVSITASLATFSPVNTSYSNVTSTGLEIDMSRAYTDSPDSTSPLCKCSIPEWDVVCDELNTDYSADPQSPIENDAEAQRKSFKDVVNDGFMAFQPGVIWRRTPGAPDELPNTPLRDTHTFEIQPELHSSASLQSTTNVKPHRILTADNKEPVEHSLYSSVPANLSHDIPASFTNTPERQSPSLDKESAAPMLTSAVVDNCSISTGTSTGLFNQSRVQETSATAATCEPDSRFAVLIEVLRTHAQDGIHEIKRSQLGADLLKRDKAVYENAGTRRLKDYVELAVEAGLVKATKQDVYGESWVELFKQNDEATQTSQSPSSVQTDNTTEVDDIFGPLLAILDHTRGNNSYVMQFSSLGQLIRQQCPEVYELAGVHGLKQYLQKAEEEGLVRIGGIAPAQWVKVVEQ